MKKSLTLCLLMGSLCGFGQYIPNRNFNEFETIPCPFNGNETVTVYKDWLLYQTLDEHWDGPIDSTVCINVITSNSTIGRIDLQTVDLSRPIFARCKFTESNKVYLDPDRLYNISASINDNPNQVYLQGGTDCLDNMCSGLFIGIQVPDETGNGTAMRWYKDIPENSENIEYFETCVPTEYFSANYLRELIIKMKPTTGTTPSERIRLRHAGYSNYGAPNYVTEVIAPQFTYVDTSYQVPIQYVVPQVPWMSADYMLKYTNTSTWPSSSNPSYVEGRPIVNTPDPKTINLIVEWETFVPQPFAFLLGALVEGSDSIRHNVNLVNNGGDMCIGGPIDFVFEDNTKYIHAGGHVNFEGNNACMMFRNGGTLEVADGVTMQYGQDGRGIMALRSGGKMKLGEGSTLLFDGFLWLQGIPTTQHPDPQFYLDLKPGMSLIFGEGAHITNVMSTVPDVKLNVYMNGGTLDDSKLNDKARQRINRIYPKPSKRFADNVQLLQNPSLGTATIGYTAAGNERVLVEIHDLQGRLTWYKTFDATEGLNNFEVDINGTAAGVYVATVSANGGRASLKMMRF
ncbi:MAG: T9SS type A sorting domain-containing protein [Saprospiraceae bacterium]|nr:T9SS type A sorting domain-containing protein [Saprospiraceae bacterium]